MIGFDSRDLMVTALDVEEFENCPTPTRGGGTQCEAGKCTCCTNPSSKKRELATDEDLALLQDQLAAIR